VLPGELQPPRSLSGVLSVGAFPELPDFLSLLQNVFEHGATSEKECALHFGIRNVSTMEYKIVTQPSSKLASQLKTA